MSDWIIAEAGHLVRVPRVRDTRIAVALLLELLACGITIPEIAQEYRPLANRLSKASSRN